VYTVTIGCQPTCTCPDHLHGRAGGRCKHILFVMLRVLKLEQTNPLVWQRALLKQEVRGPAGLKGAWPMPGLTARLCCSSIHNYSCHGSRRTSAWLKQGLAASEAQVLRHSMLGVARQYCVMAHVFPSSPAW
jgi:hypothetical protein